jgi:hypothetical protein
MLSRRLINHAQASDEAEASMITKLKEACGFEYTNKLSRMFQDMGVSSDLEKAFLDSLTERDSLGRPFPLCLSDHSRLLNPGFEHGKLASDCSRLTFQSPGRINKTVRTFPKFLHFKTLGS